MSEFRPYQSSFETEDVSRVLKTDDPWFRPVDIKAGPDGCIYVADMYEQRIDHSSHYAGRIDRTNGRIYRIKGKSSPNPKVTVEGDLVAALKHPQRAHRQTANRLIGDRKDASMIPALLAQAKQSDGQTALESLWALYQCGGLTEDVARQMLADHR